MQHQNVLATRSRQVHATIAQESATVKLGEPLMTAWSNAMLSIIILKKHGLSIFKNVLEMICFGDNYNASLTTSPPSQLHPQV